MELIKDNDCVIDYHPRKANVVAYALSRKSVQMLRALNAHLSLLDDSVIVAKLIAKSDLLIDAVVNHNRVGKKLSLQRNRMDSCTIEIGFMYRMMRN